MIVAIFGLSWSQTRKSLSDQLVAPMKTHDEVLLFGSWLFSSGTEWASLFGLSSLENRRKIVDFIIILKIITNKLSVGSNKYVQICSLTGC